MHAAYGLLLVVLVLGVVALVAFLLSMSLPSASRAGTLDPRDIDVIHAPGQAARQAIDELEHAYVYEELQRSMDSDEHYADMLRAVDEQLRRQQ